MLNLFVRSALPALVGVIFVLLLTSCPGEEECDTLKYANPSIELVHPDTSDITVHVDSLFTIVFHLRAEGGLNTLSMNGEPLHVFLKGETDEVFEFSRYFWEGREYLFVLHDLCNNSGEYRMRISVEYPY